MLKDIRRKVMQIANRLVGQGKARTEAMLTAWKIIHYKALRTKVNGTSFDNRQNVLQLLCKYNPANIAVKFVRDRDSQKTAQLSSLLKSKDQLNSVDIGLFKSCINRILISNFCTIEVEFINGVHIKNITERTGENYEHSAKCDNNSCEGSDRDKSQ